MMKNRTNVILHKRDGWRDDFTLALTEDQIRLLRWLLNEDLISADDWDLQVMEETTKWVEV